MESRSIGFELRALGILIKRRLMGDERVQALCNMSGVHGWAIAYVYENQHREVYQRDIQAQFHVRRSTASAMLARMERDGWIVRVGVPGDARLKKIELTQKAREHYLQIRQEEVKIEARLAAGLSQEEIQTFLGILRKIKNNLEDAQTEKE